MKKVRIIMRGKGEWLKSSFDGGRTWNTTGSPGDAAEFTPEEAAQFDPQHFTPDDSIRILKISVERHPLNNMNTQPEWDIVAVFSDGKTRRRERLCMWNCGGPDVAIAQDDFDRWPRYWKEVA